MWAYRKEAGDRWWNTGVEVPVPLLRGITTSFQMGEVTAVLGTSGAGKSTLLKTLTGHLGSGYHWSADLQRVEPVCNFGPSSCIPSPLSLLSFEGVLSHLDVIASLSMVLFGIDCICSAA